MAPLKKCYPCHSASSYYWCRTTLQSQDSRARVTCTIHRNELSACPTWPLQSIKWFGTAQSVPRTSGVSPHVQDAIFSESKPLGFVAIDIVGLLPETIQSKHYLLFNMNRFLKLLTRAVLTLKMTATHTANLFMSIWLIPYGIPTYLLADNRTQFASKCFATACALLKVKHLTTTAYHLRTKGQAERFNKTILAHLQHYAAEHQKFWDTLVQLLSYAYNTHRFTARQSRRLSLLSLVVNHLDLPY